MAAALLQTLPPDCYDEIMRMRALDPEVDEICRDIEMLEREFCGSDSSRNGDIEREVRRVLNALRDELIAKVQTG